MTTVVPAALEPISALFWFSMSIALTVGLAVAYPINWWLVSRGLKHGMMTVRPDGRPGAALSQPGDVMASGPSTTAAPMGGHAMDAEIMPPA